MQRTRKLMQEKAAALLKSGQVSKVLAWRSGEFFYDNSPAAFTDSEACSELVYDEFCPANLSKYLMEASRKKEKTAVFLKPCDTYGVNQLLKDNRIQREYVYAIGTPCSGMLDIRKIKAAGCKGIQKISCEGEKVLVDTVFGPQELSKQEVLLDKCLLCKGNAYAIADEELGEKLPTPECKGDPLAGVKALEALPARERFAFWQKELSKCIRCNACRDICPACSCERCIFDHPDTPMGGKAAVDAVEENLFHIIRAFHVAGRCIGCGECARVCPQGIKLGLLNMKFIKDISSFYGPYQAGADCETPSPLLTYTTEDIEPNAVKEGR